MKSFEESFARLEAILQQMNEPTTSLENSLQLFVEADTLIKSCSKELKQAEEKVRILMKNRDGSIQVDEALTPKTEECNY